MSEEGSALLVTEKDISGPKSASHMEDSKDKEFNVDYDNLFKSAYDPLKDTIRYLMSRLKAQDDHIKDLGKEMHSSNEKVFTNLSDLEKGLMNSFRDLIDRVEKRKLLL